MNSISNINVNEVREYFLFLQNKITDAVIELEKKAGCDAQFVKDVWQRPQGGDGKSCVLEHISSPTKVFEKVGVNFSHIMGESLPVSATATRPELEGRSFEAMGVSVVMHPHNPHAPTSHMNVRFFIASKQGCDPVWWFGGGFDLTPYYPYEEDCLAWHQTAADLSKPFDELLDIGDTEKSVYQHFKEACDDYFYLKHRQESRGIGGLFVDDLNSGSFENCYAFIQAIGEGYVDAYMPIVSKRFRHVFEERHRGFQLYRRGRYVEFNLVFDRGTLFGLQTAGRIESILMSLPPVVEWRYNWSPEDASEESKLQAYLKPREWAVV